MSRKIVKTHQIFPLFPTDRKNNEEYIANSSFTFDSSGLIDINYFYRIKHTSISNKIIFPSSSSIKNLFNTNKSYLQILITSSNIDYIVKLLIYDYDNFSIANFSKKDKTKININIDCKPLIIFKSDKHSFSSDISFNLTNDFIGNISPQISISSCMVKENNDVTFWTTTFNNNDYNPSQFSGFIQS